jgi:transcriptional regulator with XRE-family HTH domain
MDPALGDTVRRLREERGWSRGDLAKDAGISYWQVQKVEEHAGGPSWEVLEGLAKAFSVTISDLTAGVPRVPDEDPQVVQQVEGLVRAVEKGMLPAATALQIMRNLGFLERRPLVIRRAPLPKEE